MPKEKLKKSNHLAEHELCQTPAYTTLNPLCGEFEIYQLGNPVIDDAYCTRQTHTHLETLRTKALKQHTEQPCD